MSTSSVVFFRFAICVAFYVVEAVAIQVDNVAGRMYQRPRNVPRQEPERLPRYRGGAFRQRDCIRYAKRPVFMRIATKVRAVHADIHDIFSAIVTTMPKISLALAVLPHVWMNLAA